jgi:AcrR family transcriptional regulator
MSSARRKPVQGRSQDTVQQIFAATSVLLEKCALGEITTVRIAREAGLSIGALYRFFPDKQAIYDAIAVRRVEEFREAVTASLANCDLTDGPSFLNAVIDAYIAFLDAHPDFRTLALSRQISPATHEDQVQPDAGAPSMVRSFMIGELGVLAGAELNRKLRIASETGEHLIAYAYQQRNEEHRRAVIAELKALLSGYLFSS